ncbi:SDR family NAD(P)-dependent oxidoreductase [Actinomadura parmotrematis]|uniref:SDR family oxidoreductase n=1 Tax=Actinomadura parmotrematis TaxID=2864039 RepID=A0ABS7G7A5_9ACTN|nr:SDR family oxidoreductase [Actinomadura parmotrematis]MBW8487749.1 SDR family oxidoreductase [Actinomadura parmotrematis]
MLLDGKVAVIYGGGGKVGGAVAGAFAREGARVHLAGRTAATLDAVAARIRAAGGAAETAVLDALDEAAVDAHADAVAAAEGSLDISFNLVEPGVVQGTPLAGMSLADFEGGIHRALRTLFLTSRAAARHMVPRGSGVILVFGGHGPPTAGVGGLQVALQAQETLAQALAAELGPHGVRTVTLQTGGIPESIPADLPIRDEVTAAIEGATLLGRAATLADVGDVAAFVASDRARTITGSAVNITCGATAG